MEKQRSLFPNLINVLIKMMRYTYAYCGISSLFWRERISKDEGQSSPALEKFGINMQKKCILLYK